MTRGACSHPSPLSFVDPPSPTFCNHAASDPGNALIRVINPATGAVSSFAGIAGQNNLIDGPLTQATFHSPGALAVSADGSSVLVLDRQFSVVRNVRVADAYTYTIAGGVSTSAGFADGVGRGVLFGNAASYQYIGGLGIGQVTYDAGGNAWISDSTNARIRVMAPSGRVTTILGGYAGLLSPTWFVGYNDGPQSTALFNSPRGVLVNGSGVAYAAAPLVAWVAGEWGDTSPALCAVVPYPLPVFFPLT